SGNKIKKGNPFSLILDSLTMAIGNVHNAPITLNALIMEHPIIQKDLLYKLILEYYSLKLTLQFHKLLGSADILGNPVGLFNTFSSAVKDAFYEPYLGLVSDNPQDFGIGLAKVGGASFLNKTVYGLSDAFSKFTGSVGKGIFISLTLIGLSVVTLDSKFQEKRRQSKSRNKPKHVFNGVALGAKSFASSIKSGVTGLIEKPTQGAIKDGVGGFFKGIGKGLVGAVSKPIVGVFDLASNVSEGIKNTTIAFDEFEVSRIRLPRFIAYDRILRPFSERDAIGQSFLKECAHSKYINDFYVAHINVPEDNSIAIVSNQRIIYLAERNLKLIWEIPFDSINYI
ncbi:hypothetical protein ROZALSC1DRAFT_17209, partial [Rozella allomycis CSF55]